MSIDIAASFWYNNLKSAAAANIGTGGVITTPGFEVDVGANDPTNIGWSVPAVYVKSALAAKNTNTLAAVVPYDDIAIFVIAIFFPDAGVQIIWAEPAALDEVSLYDL